MKHDDLYTLLKGLRDPSVRLPLHQRALREQLLEAYKVRADRRRPSSARLAMQRILLLAVVGKKRIPLGIALVIVVGLLGILLLLWDGQPSSGKKLIVTVPKASSITYEADPSTAFCDRPGTCPENFRPGQRPSAASADKSGTAALSNTATSPDTHVATSTNDRQSAVVAAVEMVASPADLSAAVSLDKPKKEKVANEPKQPKDKKDKAATKDN